FSYDVYAKDINLNSVNEFSSISLNNFNKNGNKNNKYGFGRGKIGSSI
ncbi:hypothetical protein VAMP_311n1, partial [Candidatus Vampirococcus lugosii]|nr:hypothetical protein [Candidatus Vampirococcus lugosii]